ncbi:MAG: NFACT family protein [Ruthenibacterium lactatiformans]
MTLTNYYDGKEVTIPLDAPSPSANAQKYFKEY